MVLCDLAYVSSKQTVLHCSEPSAIDLSVPQADRLSCSNQGRRGYPSGGKSCKSAVWEIRWIDARRLNSRKEARQTLLVWSCFERVVNFKSELLFRRFVLPPPISAESLSTSLCRDETPVKMKLCNPAHTWHCEHEALCWKMVSFKCWFKGRGWMRERERMFAYDIVLTAGMNSIRLFAEDRGCLEGV